MAKAVKREPPRPYTSTLRADQARETRRRIRAAADTLFLERGYVDTSMDDVARAAGVSRQTVFSAFGSKAGLLKDVIDVRLVGDDEPLAINDRPDAQRMMAATDPNEAIRLMAKIVVDVAVRVGPMWRTFFGVVDTDPELGALGRQYEDGRREGMTAIVEKVASLGALRKGRSKQKAVEAVWLLSGPATTAVALDHGWKPAEVERWFIDCATAVLVDPAWGPA